MTAYMNAMADALATLQETMASAVPATIDQLGLLISAGTIAREDGSLAVVDATGNVRFTATNGPAFGDMGLAEFVKEIRAARPELFVPTEATVAPVISGASAAISLSARVRASTAAHAAKAAVVKATPTTVNPFDPKFHNLTAQMVMLNTNPALARQMKAALLPAGKQ